MADLDAELKQLVSSAVLVLFGTVLGAGSTLIERVIIGRFLSVDIYGEISIVLSLVSISVVISIFGFTKGIPRYMSRDTSPSTKRGIWWSGVAVSAVVSLSLTTVLLTQSGTVSEYFLEGQVDSFTIQLLISSIPFIVGIRIAVAGIRGLENTNYRIVVNDLFYPLSRISLILFLLLAGVGTAAVGQAYLIASATSFLLGLFLLDRLVSVIGQVDTNVRELLRFSFPLLLSSIFGVLLLRMDTLLLGLLSTSHEVGLYNAAYPLAHGLIIVLRAFGYLYLPVASRLDANSERESMERVYQMTTKWVILATFPLLSLFVVYPDVVLSLLFGKSYQPAALALIILSGGFFVNAFFGRNVETLSALGDTRSVFVGNMIGFLLNVGLNVVVIPIYGIEGAAAASAICFTAQNLYINGILKTQFDIHPFTKRSYRLLLMLSGALLLTYVSKTFVTIRPLGLVPVYALGVATLLAIVSILGCLEEEDLLLVSYIEEKLGMDLQIIRQFV